MPRVGVLGIDGCRATIEGWVARLTFEVPNSIGFIRRRVVNFLCVGPGGSWIASTFGSFVQQSWMIIIPLERLRLLQRRGSRSLA